jgi:tetratricopeptide (TPR) repeat protein
MKHSRVSRFLVNSLGILVCSLTLLSATLARGAECPASSPDRTEERRALAKEWFARAEAAENAGNDVEAVRAYSCSMRMVAHAFTAYNMGRVAERSGDLELALKSYRAYLTLKDNAPDKEEVQTKIRDLQTKINEVKEGLGSVAGPSTETAPPTVEEKPQAEPIEPPPQPERPLLPPPKISERAEGSGGAHILEWAVGGAAVAALTVGIITNVLARSNMDTANKAKDYSTANSAWNSAKTQAYTSYAMFGLAGVAAVVEGILLYRLWSSSDSSSDTSLSLGWMPGGLSLGARGRF